MTYVLNVKDNGSVALNKINNNVNILNQSLTKVDKSTNIFNESLGFLATASANVVGIAISKIGSELLSLGKSMIDSYDSASKLSANIGITAESVLGLRHAAELSAVGSEAMDQNMVKLSKTIVEAASGSKQASDAFGKMGISVKNADGSVKNSEKVLMEMADAFQKLPDGAQKAKLAMDVFGESGSSMVSMLKDGSGALKEMVDEGTAAAGNVASIAESMGKLNDASTQAKSAMMGLLAGVADSDAFKIVVSGIEDMSKALIKWNKSSKEGAEKEKTENLEKLRDTTVKYEAALQAVARAETNSKDEKQAAAKADKLLSEQIHLQFKLKDLKADQLELDKEILKGRELAAWELSVLGLKDAGILTEMIAGQKAIIENEEKNRNAKVATAEAAAKANLEFEKNEAARKKAEQEKEAAMKKIAEAYQAEGKRLADWLESFRNAKKTESEIAEDNYRKEIANLDELLKRKKISKTEHSVYSFQAHEEYTNKLKEIDKKYQDEKAKAEEEAQNRAWGLRRIAAKNSQDMMGIELEQIEARYAKEIKIAEAAKEDTKLLEAAKAAEIAGIREQASQKAMSEQEHILSLRKTAAQSEAEQIALEMESINMKYAAELEKAQGNADLTTEIEQAKNAEIGRLERQLHEMRQAQAMQQIDSVMNTAAAIATLSGGSAKAMQAIALSQAIINNALAATKAATAAPWPFNIPLVAGAILQGAAQVKTISAQKFASGGMIPGANTLIMANEQGREAILNTRAVRAIGGEMGVNALNRGASNNYSYDNSRSSNIVINTSIMTQKAFRDEIEPILKRAERRR
jgi:hypothetical protein